MTPTPSFAFTRRATSRAKAAVALAAAVVSLAGNRLFGQGAEIRVKKYVVSSRRTN